MDSIEEALSRATTLTFDCYGTLIDWAGGLEDSFRALFGDPLACRTDELFDVYVRTEAEIEARPGGFWKYREFLPVNTADAMPSLGEVMTPLIPLNFSVPEGPCWLPCGGRPR